jgi:hypothetical protein
MTNTDLQQKFESNLEALIKSCFRNELYDDSDEFYIAADYDTSCRLNDLVKNIGLEVYGMSITPSNFIITFEFVGDYQKLHFSHRAPQYCHINLDNDGNYDLVLTKDDLNKKFWIRITDIEFNRKELGDDKFNDALKAMCDTLLIYQLKI